MSSDRGKSLDSGLWPTREAWVVDINILSCTVRRLAGRVGTPVVAGCLVLRLPGLFKLGSLPSPPPVIKDNDDGNYDSKQQQ